MSQVAAARTWRRDSVTSLVGSNGGNWNPAGAPPLDYWTIPTAVQGLASATFPPDLVVKPVKAMCPLRVCRVCGEPSRRITEAHYIQTAGGADMDHKAGKSLGDHSRVTQRLETANQLPWVAIRV